MAKDLTLFWGSGSPPCWRVMIVLEEKNLKDYNGVLLSFEKGEHKSQQVLELNPRGQLPTLKHGDNVVNESLAACLYLESQFKSQGNQLIPDDPAGQALMYQRVMESLVLAQKMTDFLYYNMFVPEQERHDSAVKRRREALVTEVELWEGYLCKQGAELYLAGKTFSLADAAVFPTVAFLFRSGLSAERFPKLARYHNQLKARPSIEATWPPHWLENPEGQDKLKDL